MDKQILNHLLTESLEYTALRDREFFVQEIIERFKHGKQKEIETITSSCFVVTKTDFVKEN
jgi:hypothetical protein